ncbi:MAG TPA: flagellar basal body-associated FliL family protein [Terriglobales bacterium]|nr:flagellar basal body-associated FliL family protein [Terriglobales bacterium]
MAEPAIAEQKPPRYNLEVKWVVALAVVLVSAAWVVGGRNAARTPAAEPSGAAVKSVLHLDPFVLNLGDPDERAYLRVGIDLGLERERKGENPPTALVRDTILDVLTRSTPDDVLTEDGKNRLKLRLLAALRQRAPELQVEEIYFTEFLVQR